MSRWPVSNKNCDVITVEPAVTAAEPCKVVVGIALLPVQLSPLTSSPFINSVVPIGTYLKGLVIDINLALAPEVCPVTISPLTKGPLSITPSFVNVGAAASLLASSESNTQTNLNASDLPKEICLSDCFVPQGAVAPAENTLSSLHNFVDFDRWVTWVFVTRAVIFTEVPEVPNTAASVSSKAELSTFPTWSTISPFLQYHCLHL